MFLGTTQLWRLWSDTAAAAIVFLEVVIPMSRVFLRRTGAAGFLTMAFLLGGCQKKSLNPSFPLEILLSAPKQVTIGSNHFTLETYLWRDFMPSIPSESDGSPLMAQVKVTEMDSFSIPSYIDARRMWVINGKDIWEAILIDDPAFWPGLPFMRVKIANGGPKWGPLISVNVVVSIEDNRGRSYLLRASNQWIYRTD